MAPFKLKFRMGSSRSTSQEHDSDPQVNEALLNHHQHHSTAIGASSSTIDSTDCTSLGSMGTNERKSLLPNKTNNMRLGYIDHRFTTSNDVPTTESNAVPTTPLSTYDYMLEELKVIPHDENTINDRRDSLNNPRNNIILSSLEHLALNEEVTIECTDPNCQDNYLCNEQLLQQREQNASLNEFNNFHEFIEQSRIINQNIRNNEVNNSEGEDECEEDNRKESIDSTELLISAKMTTSTTSASASTAQETTNLVDNCRGNCEQCQADHYNEECNEECNTSGNGETNRGGNSNDFFDPLINHGGYCSEVSHYNQESGDNQLQDECQRSQWDTDADGGWSQHEEMSNSHSHEHQLQQQQQSQTYDYEYGQQPTQERSITPEIISNKSSKEIYKDLAKQWGITCKMSDACRCMECQGHYFDCEYDDNEHQKTDGGLGAGTPMFISEVMHGSACSIL